MIYVSRMAVMYQRLLFTVCLFPGVVVAQMSVGGALPDTPLTYVQGGETSAHALLGAKGGVFVFWSNDCSWTQQYEARILSVSTADIPVILVNSNDVSVFPKEAEAGRQYDVAYVRDSGGVLAKVLGAKRTPHVFLFNTSKRLAYAGGVDDAPSDAQMVQDPWLQTAVSQLSSGQNVSVSPTKSFGCRIKLP